MVPVCLDGVAGQGIHYIRDRLYHYVSGVSWPASTALSVIGVEETQGIYNN